MRGNGTHDVGTIKALEDPHFSPNALIVALYFLLRGVGWVEQGHRKDMHVVRDSGSMELPFTLVWSRTFRALPSHIALDHSFGLQLRLFSSRRNDWNIRGEGQHT